MSKIPSKSRLQKPQTVRISTSSTSRIPGTQNVHTESRTFERDIPSTSGTSESSCSGTCSDRRQQIPPPSVAAPVQQRIAAPRTGGLRIPSAGTIPRTSAQVPTTNVSVPSSQLTQPSRPISAPQVRKLLPPQTRQLVAPPSKQLPVSRARQIPPPEQIPPTGQLGSCIQTSASCRLTPPVQSQPQSRLALRGPNRPSSGLVAPGPIPPPRRVAPPQQIAPPSGLAPPRQLIPPSELAPPRQIIAPSGLNTSKQIPPPSALAPPRQVRPPCGLAPPRHVSAPYGVAPLSQTPPSSGLAPPRQIRPLSGLAPPRQIRPSSGLAPPRQVRPPSGLVPSRQIRPLSGPASARQPQPSELAPPRTISQPSELVRPRQIRPPSGLAPPRQMRPPAGLAPPRQIRPPSGLAPPRQSRPPSGLLPTGQIRPPSGLAPPRPSRLTPPDQMPSPISAALPGPSRSIPTEIRSPKSTKIIEQEVQRKLNVQIQEHPEGKAVAKAMKQAIICPAEIIETPAGPEQIVQKAVLEKRVERDGAGERIIKNLEISEKDDSGSLRTHTMGIQQFDPQYLKADGGREVIGVTSTVSVTPSYRTLSQEFVRVNTQPEIGTSPSQIAQLVEEEKEDVENTLRMVPPDLIREPGKYEMKQRQQRLRLHSESMALLEQSIIQPEPTADESQAEPTPEAMATMMYTVEKGISPQSEPDQVFNSLFDEGTNEQFIEVTSVTPGPLQDVVVPTDLPKEIHMEALTENMTQLTEKMNTRASLEEAPYVDIFTRIMNEDQLSPKGKNKQKSYQPISKERSLWVNAKMEYLVNVIGAEPAEVIDPYNLDELLKSGKLEEELSNGIDYFVEANPVQYMSRVQLRGSQMPPYFPGYMLALPDFPEVLKIAKSPDEVYASAWKAVQPKYFEEDSTLNLSF